jgi:UDP-N-acetyl-D-galactosamine dehydrogenase
MNKEICIVGLGYVGLPLAVAFSKSGFEVTGFDINEKRIKELKNNLDSSKETSKEELEGVNIDYTSDAKGIRNSNFIIIAVPTPITKSNRPNLDYLRSASKLVGENLSKDSIVVYESTVYPGVTEEVCMPILEQSSGLKCGEDFKIGYSPERINPGDKEHTIEKIMKVVSGMDQEATDQIAEAYGKVIKAGIFKAANIKTAEAAKVIENIQRDLNIALMNELTIIFDKMDIDVNSVLGAASTKWNFHKYHPGLVGGHCIGVDPYYLTYKAEELGYHPEVILAGRRINDNMHKFYTEKIIKRLIKDGKKIQGAKVLIMGLTFKPNVPDYRNSRAKNMILELKKYYTEVFGCDPLLSNDIVEKEFGVKNFKFEDIFNKVDLIVLVVKHDIFNNIIKPEMNIFDIQKLE